MIKAVIHLTLGNTNKVVEHINYGVFLSGKEAVDWAKTEATKIR